MFKDFPDLEATHQRLEAEKAKLVEALEPLRARREKVLAQLQPLEEELRKVNAEIKPHQPRLVAIDNQLGALARAAGGRSMGEKG